MAYATVEELIAGWRSLTPHELSVAPVLLERATLKLDASINEDNLTDAQKACLPIVCMDMTKRAIDGNADNPAWNAESNIGDIYLTAQEKRLLGIGGGSVMACVYPDD